MLFDKFAGVVERHLPELKPLFDKAAIFNFKELDTIIPSDYQNLVDLSETFILPFDVVAIENDKSCCILYDKNQKEIGINRSFNFLIYSNIRLMQHNGLEIWTVNKGTIEDIALKYYDNFDNEKLSTGDETNYVYEYSIDFEFIYSVKERDTKLVSINFKKSPEDYYEKIAGKILIIIEQLLFLNTPSKFVLEVIPKKTRKFNSKRITITPDRPMYTLLTISEIQKKYGLGESEEIESRKSPVPHPRRRHYRILRSDKFTHKQGERILIPAMWIGKSEVVMGNKIYKVRLDV
jgi:hypothetical protein